MNNTLFFYDIADIIDEKLVKYSSENFKDIQRYFEYEGIKLYFVSKLKESDDFSQWLLALKNEDFFNPNNYVNIDDKVIVSSVFWEIIAFLKFAAEKNDKHPNAEVTLSLTELVDLLIEFFIKVKDTWKNQFFERYLTEIILLLPTKNLTNFHLSFLRDVLCSTGAEIGLTHSIGHIFIPKLIKYNSRKFLIDFLQIIFDYRVHKTDWIDKYKSIINERMLFEILQKNKNQIAQFCGYDAMQIVLQKMSTVCTEDPRQFNMILIPTIEDHFQTSSTPRYDIQLVHFVRDMLRLLKSTEIKQTVVDLLNKDHQIFKRIAIATIDFHYNDLNDLFWNWRENPLNERFLKRELFSLLENHNDLLKDKIDIILDWIETRKYYIPDDIKDNKSEIEKAMAYYKKEWLVALLNTNDLRVKKAYDKYDKINPLKKDHPGFDTWTETRVGHKSPIRDTDLSQMNNDKIAEYISAFKAKEGWDEPSIEGLSEIFQRCVANNPEKFSNNIECFLRVPKIYIYSLLLGLLEAWRTGKTFRWNHVFDFQVQLIKQLAQSKPHFIDGISNYDNWIATLIADTVFEIMKKQKSEITPDTLSKIEILIFELTHCLSTEIEDVLEKPIYVVLNSTRYAIYKAVINYAYVLIQKKDDTHKQLPDSIRLFLSERLERRIDPSFEFSFTLGSFLNYIYGIDKEWFSSNLKQIFPDDNPFHWKATFSGYLYSANTLYKGIYKIFKDNDYYKKAITISFGDKMLDDQVVNHACLGFLEKWDGYDDEDSIIKNIIENKQISQLNHIVDFILHIKDRIKLDDLERIRFLWGKIYEISIDARSNEDFQKLLSDLTQWLSIIKVIDGEVIGWLYTSIQYFKIKPNESTLVKNLRNFVRKQPKMVGEIFIQLLSHGIYPYFNEKDIREIVKILYEKKETTNANSICNYYGKKGYHHIGLRNLYKKYRVLDK